MQKPGLPTILERKIDCAYREGKEIIFPVDVYKL